LTTADPLRLDMFDHAADLPAEVWGSTLSVDDFFLSQPWLKVVEATARVPMRYLVAHRADRPVAALATALLDDSAPWSLGRPDRLLALGVAEGRAGAAELRDALPDDLAGALLPTLVCGGRHLGRTRMGLSAEASRDDVHTLVELAEQVAETRGARSVCFLYTDERDEPLRAVLDARGYACHESARYCWLSVPDGGFDGYLAGLSAHRRRRVRAERRRLRDAGIEMRLEPLEPAIVDRLADLETQLFAKYGMTAWQPRLSAELLHQVRTVLGERAVVSVARAGGKIRGFGLLLRFGDQWFVHRTGFDYEFQAEYQPESRSGLPLYNEVNYHYPLEYTERFGIRDIHYGIGSTEAKLLRGCQSTRQFSYLRPLPVT
jgi:uncharacterized protein